MQLLIVNADDFGFTAGANRGILDAHSRGVLTSTTAMASGAHVAAVTDARRDFPDLGIGIHVQLSDGRPVADPSTIRSLVGPDGRFVPERVLLRRTIGFELDPADVSREVMAQLAVLRSLGIEPTHWDAHRSVAFWPRLLGMVSTTLAAAGIRRARTPRIWLTNRSQNPSGAVREWRRDPKHWVTDANRAFGRRVIARTAHQPDYRTGAGMVVGEMSLDERWRVMFDGLPVAGTCEVVSHPAYVDDDLQRLAPAMCDERLTDLAALTAPQLEQRLRERGYTLGHFGHLPG